MRTRLAVSMLATVLAWATAHAEPPSYAVRPHAPPGDARRSLTRQEKRQIRLARREFGRAKEIENTAKRQGRFRQFVARAVQNLERDPVHPDVAIELATLQGQALIELGEQAQARAVIKALWGRCVRSLSQQDVARWMEEYSARLRAGGRTELAILHLRECQHARPATTDEARWGLLMGDLLAQQAIPDGPYDRAIEQYGRVVERFGTQYPDVGADAKLRLAKTLWRAGDTERAKALFDELAEWHNVGIAEEARHYPEMMSKLKSN